MVGPIESVEFAVCWNPDLVLQGGALVGAIVAAIFARWRYQTADKNLRQEQFLAAADLLGKETSREINPSAIIRVSSVLTLGRLARTHPAEFHVVVMGIFAAYLGQPTVYHVSESEQVVAPDADTTREIIKFIEGRTEEQRAAERGEFYDFQLPMDAPFEMRDDGKLYLTDHAAAEVHALMKSWGKSSRFLERRHPEVQ